MRIGKLAEPVQKRSVFRQLNQDRNAARSRYGTDCTVLWRQGDFELVAVTPDGVPGDESAPDRQVTAVRNSLSAAGVQEGTLLIQGCLPPQYAEEQLQNDMKHFFAAAQARQLETEAGQLEVSEAVRVPKYVLTGIGMRRKELRFEAGQELVLTKWTALGGTAVLAQEHASELQMRYPFSLVDTAAAFGQQTSVEKEARIVAEHGLGAMFALAQGGIFDALWEVAEQAKAGLEVDLRGIPIRQETIEVCEYFDVNPYALYSAGALLVGTCQAESLLAQLAGAGIPAAVIGRLKEGKERVIRNGEDCRFLDRPQQDEWYRLQEEHRWQH